MTTTNDNLAGGRLLQHLGMDLCALHRNAVDTAGWLNPSIPGHATGAISIKHELEFELADPVGGCGGSRSR